MQTGFCHERFLKRQNISHLAIHRGKEAHGEKFLE
jgi:hypothetical protein